MHTLLSTQAKPSGLVIDMPERNSDWDEKSKWDSRSGLRAFCICYHPAHGYLLLEAQKKKKGLHYQV